MDLLHTEVQPPAGAAQYNELAAQLHWPSLCDASARFTHPDLRRLLGVWRKQARQDGIPFRGDLTPRLLKSFLGDIVLYERVAERGGRPRWRVRLTGASFAQIMGDLTGKFIDEVVPAEFQPRWTAALDITLQHRAPLRFLSRADTSAMHFLHGEYFSAPLKAADGSTSLVLGAGRFAGGRPWQDVEAEARLALA